MAENGLRTMPHYPVTSRVSIIECPVHGCDVALNDAGRIASRCPECHKEYVYAMRLRNLRRKR